MSRTKKQPRWWYYYRSSYGWLSRHPWKMSKDDNRRYKYYRKLFQRRFRQRTRLNIIHDREVPDLPPINWFLIY